MKVLRLKLVKKSLWDVYNSLKGACIWSPNFQFKTIICVIYSVT